MTTTCPEGDFGFFSSRLEGAVLVIRFKKNLMEHLTDLSKRDIVGQFADQVSRTADARVILLNSDFQEAGCEAYTRFFLKQSRSAENFNFHKLMNITSQLVMGILSLDRLVIHACQGSVISLFLNISLACDYRIAADNTMFCNPYLDLGLIPVGGGPYFLSKMMGTGKVWEILLLSHDITAGRALELGLVDRVVPSSDLDDTALEMARKFADTDAGTIAGLKRLVNFSRKDLKAYFDLEKQEILRLITSSDFSRKMEN
jgi:2-(1,2-epoxy-1,2-dihydrophenyl)acetyl-CoA isomerase